MGFGIISFLVYILFPLTGLLLIGSLTGKKLFGKVIGALLLGMIIFGVFSEILKSLNAKKVLDKEDYYGQYVINRDFFPGKQANWQYNNYRFEIKENDSIYFHVTDKDKILKTYRGTIKVTTQYRSKRLILKMEQPTHHILSGNPTTYRSAWSFYLVLYSPKFNNVYFKKGKWKPLDN